MADLISSLPDGVLKLVMHHVPVKDRLTSCCLVNSRMHVAAVAVEQLTLGDWRNVSAEVQAEYQDCALMWLQNYSQHLTRLSFNNLPKPLQQLPCPNLLDLQLSSCSVELGPAAGGQPGVVQGSCKLTRLELLDCNITALSAGVVDGLASLEHLQHLTVRHTSHFLARDDVEGLSQATLPSLTELTYLWVENLSRENLTQLGGLTNLQELHLRALEHYDDPSVGPSSVPGLVLPASLSKLELHSEVEVGLLSLIPAGLKVLGVHCSYEGPTDGPMSLLSCMARLQDLTEVELFVYQWPPAGPAYSALTASSSLVSLVLSHDAMPEGVWPHVFPASRTMLQLTELGFRYPREDIVPCPWGAADLTRLIACCPNLLKVADITLQYGPHVSELHKLTSLTNLGMYYDVVSDIAAVEDSMKGLAAVTQLKALDLEMVNQRMRVAPFLPLTSLTSLTALDLRYCSDEVPEGHRRYINVTFQQVSQPVIHCKP